MCVCVCVCVCGKCRGKFDTAYVANMDIPLDKIIPYRSPLGWGLWRHFSGRRAQVSGTVRGPLDLWRV